jgi:hypothetical protein
MTALPMARGPRVDILDLEHAHESLRSFLQQCMMPSARAVAVARFIQAVPRDVQGRSYYLDEIGPWLGEALRDDAYACWDLEHARVIDAAVAELEEAGVLSPNEATKLHALAARKSRRDSPRSFPTGGSVSGAAAAQVQVLIPLVCKIPAGPGQESADFVGMLAVLTASLRAKEPRDDPITWNNGNTLKATAGLRTFHDIAADLRVAARGAMHHLTGDAGRSDDPRSSGPSDGQVIVRAAAFQRVDLERLGFDLSIPEKQMPLAGDSIGLALAAAMAGAMVGALSGGRALRPREDLAWTGTVLASGEVLQVDRASLAAKIRVAHAAGLAGVVVPRGMGLLAREIIRRCDWDGEVVEAGSLLEVLGSADLVRPWRLPESLSRGLRRPILGTRLLAGGVIVAAVLLTGFLPRILDEFELRWYPFWRPFPPVSALRVPAQVRQGFTLALPGIRDIRVLPPPDREIGFAQISDNLEGDLQGRPGLVCGVSQGSAGGQHGYVEIRDLRVNRIVRPWRVIETAGTPFEPRHTLPGVHYDVKAGVLADVDQDGRDEIVIAASANPDAMMVLQILERNGSGDLVCTGSVLHRGYLESMLAFDVDGDGRLEIVAAGYHGPSQGMSLLVLGREDFYAPPSDSTSAAKTLGRWSLDTQPCVAHLVVPLIPGYFEIAGVTHLGEFMLGLREGYGAGKVIRVEIGAGTTLAGDYLLNVPLDLDPAGIDLIVNQQQVDQCQRWVRDGAGTDFSSAEFLERWRGLFRRTRTIQMGWDEAGAEGGREP